MLQVDRNLHVAVETGSILGKLISSSPDVTSCFCHANQAGIGWAVGPFGLGKCSQKIPKHLLGGGLAWLLVGFLQFGDIEFFHLEKRFGHPGQFLLVFILHQVVHGRGDYLP